MERILGVTKKRLAGKVEALDRFQKTYEDLRDLREPEQDNRKVSPIATMPGKIHSLLQIGLRRTLELAESFIRELNAGSFTPLFIMSRALFETGGLLLDATIRIEDVTVAKAKDKLDELDEHLMSVMFGFKSAEWPMTLEYQAKNVVTIIERLTKKLDVDLIAMYGDLSEHAHPNYLGMMAAFQHDVDLGNPVIRFLDTPLDREISLGALVWAMGGANIGIEMTKYALEKQNKTATAFRKLCEEQIYDGGTWPKHVPYPLPD
jgi:hypothetical protein